MSSVLRYRRGDCKPVTVLRDTTYAIEKGDLIFLDKQASTFKARPASSMVDQGSLVKNQEAFRDFFLGVAMEKIGAQTSETFPLGSPVGSLPTATLLVATAGEFEFDCASTTWNLGDLVGPCETSAGTALEDQKVAQVAIGSEKYAIGKAVPEADALGNAKTTVVVRIKSTIIEDGIDTQITISSSGAI
jgi:hypothetical protein